MIFTHFLCLGMCVQFSCAVHQAQISSLCYKEQIVLMLMLTFDISIMREPDGHFGHLNGKCYLLRGIRFEIFLLERASVYLWRWCALETSRISGKCWEVLQSWNVYFVNEMRVLTPWWSDLWVCLCEWIHTRTRCATGLADDLLFQTVSLSLGLSLCGLQNTHLFIFPFIPIHPSIYLC